MRRPGTYRSSRSPRMRWLAHASRPLQLAATNSIPSQLISNGSCKKSITSLARVWPVVDEDRGRLLHLQIRSGDTNIFALTQKRRPASLGDRDPIPDSHCAPIGLIEDCTPRVLAHSKNKLLPFFSFGAGLEDHLYRQVGCGHFLRRQYAVAVDRVVRSKIVVFKDKPRTWHRNTDVRISGRWRCIAIGRPVSKQMKLIEQFFDRRCVPAGGGGEIRNEQPDYCRQPHRLATPLKSTIAAVAAAAIDLRQNTGTETMVTTIPT